MLFRVYRRRFGIVPLAAEKRSTQLREILTAWVFTTLDEVRELSKAWRVRHNTERTHDSLGDVPPLTFLPTITSPDQSHFQLCA